MILIARLTPFASSCVFHVLHAWSFEQALAEIVARNVRTQADEEPRKMQKEISFLLSQQFRLQEARDELRHHDVVMASTQRGFCFCFGILILRVYCCASSLSSCLSLC